MNTPISPITDPDIVAKIALSLRPDDASISVRAELVEASATLRQAQGERFTHHKAGSIVQQDARGNRARGLDLLDKLDAYFQTAAENTGMV